MAEPSNQAEEVIASGEPEVPKEGVTQEDEVEASLDTDMNATNNEDNASAPQPMNIDGANDMVDQDQNEPVIETRLPAKKDVALREFLSKMDDYAPIVRFTPTSPCKLIC